VNCCDYDESLQPIFSQLNERASNPVDFHVADLRKLGIEKGRAAELNGARADSARAEPSRSGARSGAGLADPSAAT